MKIEKRKDLELVEAYQSGNNEAFAILVKRWHLMFCKKAYWIVKDADLSKDIAQETWQTIMIKIDQLQDPNSFGSWALRIVYTKSVDVLKKKRLEFSKQSEFQKEQPIYEENYDENSTLKKQLLKAIQSLPEHQQIVIRLFYLEDYSLKEISKTLHISVGTTKSRLFHAREKLKELLKEKRKQY